MSLERTFTAIINLRKYDICHTCGNIRTHSLIYCKNCNDRFCNHQHNLIEAMKIANDINYEGGIYAHQLRMDYILEVYKRNLPKYEFEKWLKEKVYGK